MGRPIVPSLIVDGRAIPILHVSQIASILDLPQPDTAVNAQLAWDTVTILTSWLDQLDRMSWKLLNEPTPARGRSARNLTVNTFHPFELLPSAWMDGQFPWDGLKDPEREAAMPSKEQLRNWAQVTLERWQGFLMDHESELECKDRDVETLLHGTVKHSVVLTSQRWHCAFHHRQLMHFLASRGFDVDGELDVEQIRGIELPPTVY